eukprot:CAMPEP_0184873492 /NCGR_PEP_ID=MMETSP0580-20130426/41871_1 /TAXON_ID=1118495 /ORGANISM="Dactyliosolen fragilissimus" /LENGTH=1017 /DNA_ID=CAMNT_0027376403 /DNA_START=887 /DNA_END=3936 /DNA_ORIENTATION=-
MRASFLTPLLSKSGCAILTNKCLYFQPSNSLFASVPSKAISWEFTSILATAKRYHALQDAALEIYFHSSNHTNHSHHSHHSNTSTKTYYPNKSNNNSHHNLRHTSPSFFFFYYYYYYYYKSNNNSHHNLRHTSRPSSSSTTTTTTTTHHTTPTSVLLAFESKDERDAVARIILRYRPNLPSLTSHLFLKHAYLAWNNHHISNFDYLLALNAAAGRTFHDLSRYPVFPWVIANYQTSKLDLEKGTSTSITTATATTTKDKDSNLNTNNNSTNTNKSTNTNTQHDMPTFRDLSKPIGALNEERLQYFQTRYENMKGMDNQFLYGTHYSAPGYILYYLVRTMPEHMLCLQNGKYDAPDRLFHSMDHCYASLLTNHADIKESIPQFYDHKGGADFLLNVSGLQLGCTQNGIRVDDVKLPPWAKSHKDFLRKNRKALESSYCNQNLHKWIDLIFGISSRGDKALEAMNLFHPTSYLTPTDLQYMRTQQEKEQAELQAMEFGIVPDTLFSSYHPPRNLHPDPSPHSHESRNYDLFFFSKGTQEYTDATATTENEQMDYHTLNKEKNNNNFYIHEKKEQPKSMNTSSLPNQNVSVLEGDGVNKNLLATNTESTSSNKNTFLGHDIHSSMAHPSHKSDEYSSSSNNIESIRYDDVHASRSHDSTGRSTTKLRWAADPSNPFDDDVDDDNSNGSSNEDGVEEEPQKMDHTTDDTRQEFMGQNLPLSSSRGEHGLNTRGGISDKVRESSTKGFSDEQSNINSHSYESSTLQSTNTIDSQENHQGWELKRKETKVIHGDTVSGCILSLGSEDNSYITTTSLDGGLKVHSLISVDSENMDKVQKRRGFAPSFPSTSSLSRFTRGSGSTSTKSGESKPQSFHLFRSHTSSDPLACLSLVKDESGGQVAFAGGHDDVILAYGINSACALASIYSHRDAVTGIDLVVKPAIFASGSGVHIRGTHIMVSGSWDATVKLWSVSVQEGEVASIDREPLAEYFDADSSIVCISATFVADLGLIISAGCSDGSLYVW